MSDPPRYSDALTYREFLIGSRDELDIEAEFQQSLPEADNWLRRFVAEQQAALREIDELKIAGRYWFERGRLAGLIEPPQLPDVRPNPAAMRALDNYCAGMKSPDADQRARFEAFSRAANIEAATLWEALPLLNVLDPAQRPKGRPRVNPPWRNEAGALDAMRLQTAAGASIPEAARQAAAAEGQLNRQSRAKRFERLFRQRAVLREIKLPRF